MPAGRIAGDHRPGDVPFNYIKHLSAEAFEALDLCEVPLNMRANAIGFAVQKAIDAGKHTLDPTIAADIVTELCSACRQIRSVAVSLRETYVPRPAVSYRAGGDVAYQVRTSVPEWRRATVDEDGPFAVAL